MVDKELMVKCMVESELCFRKGCPMNTNCTECAKLQLKELEKETLKDLYKHLNNKLYGDEITPEQIMYYIKEYIDNL